jgi:large subunit ribosomal protein L4
MLKIPIYNFKTGEKKGDKSVSAEVFGQKFNHALVHQAYVAITANRRTVIAHTKDRSERSGSGKKPWKQKGTGNARAGSVRSPLWRKGGIVFGPTKDRNFSKNINRKMKSKAVLLVLGEKIRSAKIKLVDEIGLEAEKTKNFAEALKKLSLDRSVLVALSPDEKKMAKICRNIRNVEVRETRNLNVADLLDTEYILISEKSIEMIEKKKEVEKKIDESVSK